MKIEAFCSSPKFEDENDYRSFFVIKIDGKTVIDFMDGEPEDANLCRDFNDAYAIVGLLKKVYAAGIAGDEVTFEESVVDDYEL